MLLNSLYIIIEKKVSPNFIEVDVALDEKHEIFKGHFPSNPILPGVCELQMVKEILGNLFGKKLQFNKADEIKFLQVIAPSQNNLLKFEVEYKTLDENLISVNARILKAEGNVCCKMKGSFSVKE